MELINTKDLYENDAFVIIEANLRTAKPKSECRKFRWDLKTTKGILQKFVPFTASNFNRKGPGSSQTAVTGSFSYSCLYRVIFTFHPQRYAARNGKPFPAAGSPQACR